MKISSVTEETPSSGDAAGCTCSSVETPPIPVTHFDKENIKLTEDSFGLLVDDEGNRKHVRRFTWKNKNKIQVQIINYGARVISIKMPNTQGFIDDVILGFDDIVGYLYYQNHYVGATLGRFSNKIEDGTFVMERKQYWLSKNANPHHLNGGFKGFDQVLWDPYVAGTKVMLNYVSRDGEEGYPGDLTVRITFELTKNNEFTIDMEAVCNKPTIVNISNLIYFNLAGHKNGPLELYRHMLTVNANCFINLKENGLPTGKITNVMYTEFDFQVPKRLGDVVGQTPEGALDANLCVNRGFDQDKCFVVRLLHVPSGRLLEIYSNQSGVNINTANDFPVKIEERISHISMDPLEAFHIELTETISLDKDTDYEELRNLVRNLLQMKRSYEDSNTERDHFLCDELYKRDFSPNQIAYFEYLNDIACDRRRRSDYADEKEIIRRIHTHLTARGDSVSSITSQEKQLSGCQVVRKIRDIAEEVANRAIEKIIVCPKASKKCINKVPTLYKDGQVHGKKGAIYAKHAGVCLRTQNYPNAIYHQNFPNCVLNPGDIYRHTTTYRFCLQPGNAKHWLRRQRIEEYEKKFGAKAP